jgi:uncharacterized membrane protein
MKMLVAPDPPEQSDRKDRGNFKKGGMARAILERRYADRKITRQQYEKLLQDLGLDGEKSEAGVC